MFRHGNRSGARHLVIVGGVAGGMSAAAEARRVDPALRITVVERLPWVSYAKCPMPRFLAGRGPSPVEGLEALAESFRRERSVDVRTGVECLAVNTFERWIRVRDLARGGEYCIEWDKLVLATGTRVDPPGGVAPGGNVHVFATPKDALALDDHLSSARPLRAGIVGGGAVGVDLAWALAARGIPSTLFERRANLLGDVSPEIASRVRDRVERHGVAVVTGVPAVEGARSAGRCEAIAALGREHPCDLVLIATGAYPETALARAAGIGVGTSGGIGVDQKLMTSARDVYACGDCAEYRHAVTGRPALSRVGTTAWRSGYAAGANAAGEFRRFGPIENTMISHVFGAFHARTGLGYEEARDHLGPRFEALAVDWTERPGEEASRLEVYLERHSLRIVGAQIFGTGNVKRIDALALALREKVPLDRLGDADFAYTPELCAARDPIAVIARLSAEARRKAAPPRR